MHRSVYRLQEHINLRSTLHVRQRDMRHAVILCCRRSTTMAYHSGKNAAQIQLAINSGIYEYYYCCMPCCGTRIYDGTYLQPYGLDKFSTAVHTPGVYVGLGLGLVE